MSRSFIFPLIGTLSEEMFLLIVFVLYLVLIIISYLVVVNSKAIFVVFELWSNKWSRGLGPKLGIIKGDLPSRVDLNLSFPSEFPLELRRGFGQESVFEPIVLQRAYAWAEALSESVIIRETVPRGTALTTYGFVSMKRGPVKLSVIHYLPLFFAFYAVAKQPSEIEIEGWKFPIVIRPWRPIKQSSTYSSGNCWIKFSGQRVGILTAAHAVRPKRARPGSWVRIDVRRTPRRGRLIEKSEKMDAAIIELQREKWDAKVAAKPSSIIGYKQIRLLSSSGPRDCWITEIKGRTIDGSPGEEPLEGYYIMFNQCLDRGDSGCVALDIEHDSMPPYLMYLGVTNRGYGNQGYGLLLEQPRRIWDVKFFV